MDVAEALRYKDAPDALKKHVSEDDKVILKPGEMPILKMSNYGAYIINESGLYALIFGSKLESAKRFKHWVTSEVLPSRFKRAVSSHAQDISCKIITNYTSNNLSKSIVI